MPRPGFEPGSPARKAGERPFLEKNIGEKTSIDDIIENFRGMLKIDLDLAERTVKQHVSNIGEFLKFIEKSPEEITKKGIRSWLKKYEENYSKATKANKIKSVRVFFREFVGSNIAEGFKIPRNGKKNNVKVPSKETLRKHYEEIQSQKYRAYFLVKASSGLRTSELTNLTMDGIDLEKRMLMPNHDTRTKRSFVSFYNKEAEKELKKYLDMREEKENDNRLWRTNRQTVARSFKRTSERSGAKVTPKVLRKWFVNEMKKIGVDPGYIDAFCGRVPKTVQDSHYTDLSPERLKEVYEKAGLTVLE